MLKTVRILIPRRWMDAGLERMLDRGRSYELPGVVADSLIATGAAELDKPAASPARPVTTQGCADTRPPEGRPQRAPETKRGAA